MTYEVYIHVPFCLRRCGYCDFNTYTARDLGAGASRGNYANMVIREMELTREWQLAHGIEEPPADTVFFGGGTPTILSADDLVAMLDAVRRIWGVVPDAEITTEANPDTVNEYYINRLAEGGFTRISFGMQSAVPHVLKTLDRTHTPANVAAGVHAADKAGLRSSVDLIYGAPGESLDDWRTSVCTAIDLGVNHISAYALTVEPTTKMGRQIAAGTLPKPDDDDEAAKYEIADELLTAAGLEWYEVSNWAKPGYESRHNLGYWRNVDWAGLGPGAHSHYNAVADHPQSPAVTAPASGGGSDTTSESGHDRAQTGGSDTTFASGHDLAPAGGGCPTDVGLGVAPSGTDATHALRAWDIAHPRMWATAINESHVPWGGSEGITAGENLEELIMLGLRIREGLDLSRINRAIAAAHESDGSTHLRPIDASQLRPLAEEGLIVIETDSEGRVRVVPTRRGRLLNDAVIERVFDLAGV
ncbi:radical SAM family heme chaperone HemW [Bifidobacterium stellenboschense]|uniref:Heme chaperone HemW n=1 Tax=Bifidobacterium stellenboschense TaxID=762211 RepID=A0A087E0D0_9BIFI|nr:radical SAM family heme chaperone HemW [Bifidobacterium stellenboschense]KFJ01231.1 oxygen-independent coproporphyrinogen III oxidase [Bifidobacterium stellenboschense]